MAYEVLVRGVNPGQMEAQEGATIGPDQRLNLHLHPISNLVIDVVSSLPAPTQARFVYLDPPGVLYYSDGTIWTSLSSGGLVDEPLVLPVGPPVFATSLTYKPGGLAFFWVNGARYLPGVNFTIAGTTVTWLGVPFALEASDELAVSYERL